MKKTIIITSVICVAVIMAAVVLGLAGGSGNSRVENTTAGTSQSTAASTTGAPVIERCEHIYTGSFCSLCGAEVPTGEEYLSFRLLEDGTYSVGAKLVTNMPKRLIIPETYNGKPVTSVKKRGFIAAKQVEYVYIPEGVTAIEDEAFAECLNVYRFVFPKSLGSVGARAFEDCDTVTEMLFEGDVKLGEYAFHKCDSLKNVTFLGEVSEKSNSVANGSLQWTFKNCPNLKSVSFEGGGKVDFFYTFLGCEKLESVVLPDELTAIGDSAFMGCKSLRKFTVPKTVSTLVGNAFANCPGLSLELEAGNANLTDIGGCIVDNVRGTVVWCNNVSSISLANGVDTIALYAVSYQTLPEQYTIPSFITKLQNCSFAYCKGLKNLVLSPNMTTVQSAAFYACEDLESVTLPKSITKIEYNAFAECKYLTKIYYEGTVEEWRAVEKNKLYGAVTVYCTDGEVSLFE